RVVVHGGDFVVYSSFTFNSGTAAIRVAPSGQILVPKTQLLLSGGQLHFSRLASDGASILAVGLDDSVQNQGKVFARRFDPNLQPLGGDIKLARDPNSHFDARVATNGTAYLAVWQDDRDGYQNVYGTRIDTNGAALDGAGFEIFHAPPDNNYLEMNPGVGSNGTDY